MIRTFLTLFAVGTLMMLGANALAVEGSDGVALFDPEMGEWHLRYPDGSEHHFFYGAPGDVPLVGDWDCDGFDTVGMYRPSNGFVYLKNSNGFGLADLDFFYGLAGDIPLVGDWNTDGCDTLAVYRAGQVFVRNQLGTGPAEFSFFFGNPGDRPFAGDFDGDGISTVGLYREASGLAYFRNILDSGVADFEFFYGSPSDRIMAGDWDGNGTETVGIFRPAEAKYFLTNQNAQVDADVEGFFGFSHFLPNAGELGPPDYASPPGSSTTTTIPSTPTTTIPSTPTTSTTTTTTIVPSTIKVMNIGDSIAEGNSGHHTYRFYLSQMYPALDMVGSRSGVYGGSPKDGNFDQNHESYWGWRADEVAPKIDWAADSYRPDVALVHLGTNDIIQGQGVQSTIGDLETIVWHLRGGNPNVKIFLAQLIECTWGQCSDRQALNDQIYSLASRLSTAESPVTAVYMGSVTGADLYDGVHPNDAGSQKMAYNWEWALQQAGVL